MANGVVGNQALDASVNRETSSGELAKYLQDHFAGARAGLDLARRLAARRTGSDIEIVAREIEIDRELLKQIMEALGVPFGPVKQATAWLGGKFVKLRPVAGSSNASSLSLLLEVEALSLGVEGKALLWQALLELRDSIPALAPFELAGALTRARGQREVLENLRLQAVRTLARDPSAAPDRQ